MAEVVEITKTIDENGEIASLPVSITKKLLGGDGADILRSNLIDLADSMAKAFNQAGSIEPPLDPLSLSRLVSMSESLPALIDAMATNIHGFGYYFEPVIDLESADAIDRVKASMLLEREYETEAQSREGEEPEKINEPTDEEIEERIESLRDQMRREKARLDAFFKNVNRKMSFTRICRRQHVDKESTGYGVIEVRRDRRGEVCRLNHGLSWTFRALSLSKPVEVESRVKATDISYRNVKESVRFRKYIQIYESQIVYFKEFGDKRVMSSKTGHYYKDEKALYKEEPEATQATELIWFSLDSTESEVYGQVRWSGCIPGTIGSREQAEVNLLFFRNKAIPPMVMMVSGGRLAKGAREKIEETIHQEIKGVENFHKILIIEAEPIGRGIGGAQGLPSQDKVKIELRPLTESIFKDALWSGYRESNKKELGQSFRLPPMMRGDTEKLNRATAKVVQDWVNNQVFGPERKDFEFDIDRTLLTDMSIMLWRFRLNWPETTDAEQLKAAIDDLTEGVLTVNEGRRLSNKLFHVEHPPIDTDWARMPIRHGLAGFQPEEVAEAEEEIEEQSEEAKQSKVLKLRVSPEFMNELVEPE